MFLRFSCVIVSYCTVLKSSSLSCRGHISYHYRQSHLSFNCGMPPRIFRGKHIARVILKIFSLSFSPPLPLSLSLSHKIHFAQRFFHCSKQCCMSFFDKFFRSFVISRFTSPKCLPGIIIFTLKNAKKSEGTKLGE